MTNRQPMSGVESEAMYVVEAARVEGFPLRARFVGLFKMRRELDLDDRLELVPSTLSPADLLLTKLQIVELNPPKSLGWRVRARVGRLLSWYELPEEVAR